MKKQIRKCNWRLLNFSLEAVSHGIQLKMLKGNSMRNVKYEVKVWRWRNKLKMWLEAVEFFIGGCEPWNSVENVEGKQHTKCQIRSESMKMKRQIRKYNWRLLNFSLEAVSHEIQLKTLKRNSMRNVKYKVKIWRWRNKLKNAIRGCWIFQWRLWAMKFSRKRWREIACEMLNTKWKYEDGGTN